MISVSENCLAESECLFVMIFPGCPSLCLVIFPGRPSLFLVTFPGRLSLFLMIFPCFPSLFLVTYQDWVAQTSIKLIVN